MHLENNYHKDKPKVYKTYTSEYLIKNINLATNKGDAIAVAEAATITEPIYFNEAMPVYFIGDEKIPAWTKENPGTLKNISPGHFEFVWTPIRQREGDYIITWSYRFEASGELKTNNMHFCLAAQPSDKVLSPRHRAEQNKYKTLLDQYLPTPYKMPISENDLTPYVIEKLHFAIEGGFTLLDNLATQLVVAIDANYTQQSLLPLLAAFFGLRLRSNDTNSWRQQNKQAVPLYKTKGTLSALKEALNQAGIKLNKITKLWQVVSPYTWVAETFESKGKLTTILLS